MSRAALVFDLDGTLSDPVLGIGRSINHALVAQGHRPLADHEVSPFIGPPLDVTFRQLIPQASHGEVLALVASYRERYGAVGFAENTLYDGVPDALSALAARGVVMGVCTSKRADFAEKILALFGLRQHFVFVSGGEIGVSKAMQLAELLAAGRLADGAQMIGDRAIDVQAAHHNGLQSVGVLWGHGSEAELREAGAGRLLARPQELAALGAG